MSEKVKRVMIKIYNYELVNTALYDTIKIDVIGSIYYKEKVSKIKRINIICPKTPTRTFRGKQTAERCNNFQE